MHLWEASRFFVLELHVQPHGYEGGTFASSLLILNVVRGGGFGDLDYDGAGHVDGSSGPRLHFQHPSTPLWLLGDNDDGTLLRIRHAIVVFPFSSSPQETSDSFYQNAFGDGRRLEPGKYMSPVAHGGTGSQHGEGTSACGKRASAGKRWLFVWI